MGAFSYEFDIDYVAYVVKKIKHGQPVKETEPVWQVSQISIRDTSDTADRNVSSTDHHIITAHNNYVWVSGRNHSTQQGTSYPTHLELLDSSRGHSSHCA